MSQFVLAVLFHGGLNHKPEKPSGRGSSGDGGGVGGDFLPGEFPFICERSSAALKRLSCRCFSVSVCRLAVKTPNVERD